MTKNRWPEVTKESCCPICGKDHRCKLAPDGNAASCFRSSEAPSGWKKGRGYQSGGGTFFRENGKQPHSPKRRKSTPTSIPEPTTPPPTAGEADSLLNRAYTVLLSELSLSDAHRQNLRERGFTDKQIEDAEFRSKPRGGCQPAVEAVAIAFGPVALNVPGIHRHGKLVPPDAGLLVPARDVRGEIVGLKLRLDVPRNKTKYVWLSSRSKSNPDGASPGSPAHVPLGVSAASIAAADGICRLTEGELKSDLAFLLSSLPTISFPGAGRWQVAVDAALALGATRLRLAFDMDARAKKDVASALSSAVKYMAENKLSWDLERWDATHKGIDDALHAGTPIEVLAGDVAVAEVEAIAKAAGFDPQSPSQKALKRLHEVLEAGGAQQLFADSDLLELLALISFTDTHAYAAARCLIRDAGVSIRAFDHAIKPDIQKAMEAHTPTLARGEDGGFFEDSGCICRTKYTPHGPLSVPLANFVAEIIEELVFDDGAEKMIAFALKGKLAGGKMADSIDLPRTEVTAALFARMEWVTSAWGTRAIVWPGEVRALPAAIQALSKETKHKTIYAHTGWRKIGENWAFLHAGGAIAAAGVDVGEVSVSLAPPLDRYCLPAPPTGAELVDAVRWSLRLLELGGDRIMVPLIGAIYRAPLGPCGLSVSLVGRTGTGKTELAALAQQHYGPEMSASHLPGSWTSTGNSLEALSFLTKDVIFVVDDFNPGSGQDVHRAQRDADRFFRSQGNHAGRGRLRPNGTPQPEKPPRCLAISTGEDLTRSHSGRARQWIVGVCAEDGIISRLTPFQDAAAAGKLAAAMAGYLRSLAPGRDSLVEIMSREIQRYRQQAGGSDQHARVPTMIAELTLGFRMFLSFAKQIDAINEDEQRVLSDRAWKSLIEGGAEQTGHHRAANPVLTFIRLVSALVSSGRAHFAGIDGSAPQNAPGFGWRQNLPLGKRIGWIDGEKVYLEPDSTFAEVQNLARDQGDPFSVNQATLYKRLNEQGLLVETDKNRQTNKVRRVIEGQRREVLYLTVESLFPTAADSTETATIDANYCAAETSGGWDNGQSTDESNCLAPTTETNSRPVVDSLTAASPDAIRGNGDVVGLVGRSAPKPAPSNESEIASGFEEGTI